jgi:putative oxidoreductase
MTDLLSRATALHDEAFAAIERALGGWLPGLLARVAFASVLLFYFMSSARTKVGEGLAGFFSLSDSAYYQIALPAVEAAGGDVSKVSFLPWGLIVHAGTYAEFVLPILVTLGLLTRLSALGMIAFIAVQSYVDVTVHQVGDAAGRMFDRFPDGVIADQRLLWAFPLAYLVIRGGGVVSLDGLAARLRPRPAMAPA